MIVEEQTTDSWLAETGLRLSDWFERWFPDAFALAMIAVIIVFLGTLAAGSTPLQSAQWIGAGFWDLVTFTMQMAMIIITGYVVAVSAPLYGLFCRIAEFSMSGRSAEAFDVLFSIPLYVNYRN